jgi:CBS domain-containing protein
MAKLESDEPSRSLRVADVMTRGPVTIAPDAPVGAAITVMREREVRHLPVVDERGRLVGVITDRDLRSALVTPAVAEHLSGAAQRRLRRYGRAVEELRVRDIMTWDAVTIEPDAPVAQAAALMFEGRFGCLPVVAAGRLEGIVTERDVLKVLAKTLASVRGVDPDTFLW